MTKSLNLTVRVTVRAADKWEGEECALLPTTERYSVSRSGGGKDAHPPLAHTSKKSCSLQRSHAKLEPCTASSLGGFFSLLGANTTKKLWWLVCKKIQNINIQKSIKYER